MKPAAAKALRQSQKNRARNVAANEQIAKLIKNARRQIAAKKWDEAAVTVRLVGKTLDKCVSRGIVKKNTAARYKSRITTRLNAAKKMA